MNDVLITTLVQSSGVHACPMDGWRELSQGI